MKVQSIDLSFLSRKTDIPKWVNWLVLGIGILIFGLVGLSYGLNRYREYQASIAVVPTPVPTEIPEPTPDYNPTDIEIIRQKWLEANEAFESNIYDNHLLQPPLIELEFSLDDQR